MRVITMGAAKDFGRPDVVAPIQYNYSESFGLP
jgi:hypothetical protein